MTTWTRDQVLLMLDEYSLHTCLFNIKDKSYKNKHARNGALHSILKNVLPLRSGTTIADIKTKYAALRTTFLSERKKVLGSSKSGCGVDEIHISNLYYYEKMAFLLDSGIDPRPSVDSLQSQVILEDPLEEDDNEEATQGRIFLNAPVYVEEGDLPVHNEFSSQTPSTSTIASSSSRRQRKKKMDSDLCDAVIVDASAAMREMACTIKECSNQNTVPNTVPSLSHIDAFGTYIVAKMNDIKSRQRLEMLMLKENNDVISALLEEVTD